MNDFPELLTPDEVAKIFRVSYHKALDIIKYHMKHIKIGNQYRVSRSEVEKLLTSKGNKNL